MDLRNHQAPFVAVAEHHLAAARLLEAAAQEHRSAAAASDIELATMHALLAYGHRVEAARHAEAAEVAIARLARRGAEEAASLRTTLERQMAHVQAEVDLHQSGARQLPLGYTAEDAANLEADRRHWVVRLRQFREDLEVAPARYQQFYAVKARRVEPIGLVYLMPDRG